MKKVIRVERVFGTRNAAKCRMDHVRADALLARVRNQCGATIGPKLAAFMHMTPAQLDDAAHLLEMRRLVRLRGLDGGVLIAPVEAEPQD